MSGSTGFLDRRHYVPRFKAVARILSHRDVPMLPVRHRQPTRPRLGIFDTGAEWIVWGLDETCGSI